MIYIVIMSVNRKVMYRIQRSGRILSTKRRCRLQWIWGLRALPQLRKCNSDPETWCARCLTLMGTGRTKFHVLNRIFLEPAGCAPLRRQYNSNIQYLVASIMDLKNRSFHTLITTHVTTKATVDPSPICTFFDHPR